MTPEPETRDKILDAAKTVFLEQGSSGARMQEIADAAGVNKALLHYYFRDKETLAGAVFQREFRRLVQPVMATLGSDLPLEDKVRRTVDLYVDGLSTFPLMPGYVMAEIHFHPERIEDFLASVADQQPAPLVRGVLERLGRQIEAEVAAGRMRPVPPRQFMVNLVSLCVFPFAARPLLRLILGGEEGFEQLIEERKATLADFFLSALRP